MERGNYGGLLGTGGDLAGSKARASLQYTKIWRWLESFRASGRRNASRSNRPSSFHAESPRGMTCQIREGVACGVSQRHDSRGGGGRGMVRCVCVVCVEAERDPS